MFVPGQKVVCIDDSGLTRFAQYFNKLPVRNEQYTVRDLVPGVSPRCTEGEVSVYLCEIQGTINRHGIERGFNAERFAPLNPQEEIVTEQQRDLALA